MGVSGFGVECFDFFVLCVCVFFLGGRVCKMFLLEMYFEVLSSVCLVVNDCALVFSFKLNVFF